MLLCESIATCRIHSPVVNAELLVDGFCPFLNCKVRQGKNVQATPKGRSLPRLLHSLKHQLLIEHHQTLHESVGNASSSSCYPLGSGNWNSRFSRWCWFPSTAARSAVWASCRQSSFSRTFKRILGYNRHTWAVYRIALCSSVSILASPRGDAVLHLLTKASASLFQQSFTESASQTVHRGAEIGMQIYKTCEHLALSSSSHLIARRKHCACWGVKDNKNNHGANLRRCRCWIFT